MAPRRCKWGSIYVFLFSLSVAASVAVAADDKAPPVEDGTLFSKSFSLAVFSGIFAMGFSYIVNGLSKNDLAR